MFWGAITEYLETRMCAQEVAREIRILKNNVEVKREFSPFRCISIAARTRDLLLWFDMFVYFIARLFHGSSN